MHFTSRIFCSDDSTFLLSFTLISYKKILYCFELYINLYENFPIDIFIEILYKYGGILSTPEHSGKFVQFKFYMYDFFFKFILIITVLRLVCFFTIYKYFKLPIV